MPKAELELVGSGEYAPVAERITAFYERYPEGRIITELVARTPEEVTFRAKVYRHPDDPRPAATGWASEREGDGAVNEVACLENTETSAIGRALANLGFTSSSRRPSAEEMARVARRRELARGQAQPARPARPSRPVRPAEARPATGRTLSLQRQADVLADAFRLLRDAERAGMPASRVAGARRRLQADPPPDESAVRALEASLRDFLGRRLRERVGEALGEVSGSGVEGRKAVKEY